MEHVVQKIEGSYVDLEAITKLLINLEEDKLMIMIQSFIDSNPTLSEGITVVQACKKGLSGVARLFESGQYFVGDVIFAGELITEISDMLKPIIEEDTVIEEKIVIGRVHGQSAKTGNHIFTKIMESAGFKVVSTS